MVHAHANAPYDRSSFHMAESSFRVAGHHLISTCNYEINVCCTLVGLRGVAKTLHENNGAYPTDPLLLLGLQKLLQAGPS
jgi:hypothetical protein